MPNYKVAEIFGPTIQGEGSDIGKACYFVRFGGCEYRCTWCDSMHAVLPERVQMLPTMTEFDIVDAILKLPGDYRTIVFSGGNPALWDLEPLMRELQRQRDFRFTMETQAVVGKKLPSWARLLDLIVFSPKPPSADTVRYDASSLLSYLTDAAIMGVNHIVKIVVFNGQDLDFAVQVARDMSLREIYLSCGTESHDSRNQLVSRYETLIERALTLFEYESTTPIVLPQLHVVVWGHKLGV